jgi:hypothetical protein
VMENNISRLGYTIERNFLDAESLTILSKYMENKLARGEFIVRKNNADPNLEASEYYTYADPMSEMLLENKLEHLQEITEKSLSPTYSFARVYVDEDSLGKHTDRPSCEYSVTVNINYSGSKWPIWMLSLEGEAVEILLSPGDAVIYKGCEVPHWRNPMVQCGCKANAQIMLHYVDRNGPFSDHKLDGRAKLATASVQEKS